ncbi:MAG: phosphoribosylformylglycinamidine cyclo-ligase [Candidatus Bathyarchaeia archaeon]
MSNKEMTYAKAGVDIEKVRKSHKAIAELLKETFFLRKGKFGQVLIEIGHYGGLIDIGGGLALALHTDGVGTKTLIAKAMNKYDSIGIDCVAMNVNDLICLGAEPVALVDYLAIDRPEEGLILELMKGLVEGANEAEVAIVGGETAVMPDLINGFDLSAMSIGVVEKNKIITGEKIRIGDFIIGLESNGIHSNGLTLARKVLFSNYSVKDYISELNAVLGEELLKPTRIYVKPILEVIDNCQIHGLANITGGAFSKLIRLKKNVGFNLNAIPEPQPIFKLIQKLGHVTDKEMHRTFNMGIGFCIIAPKKEWGKIREICGKYRLNSWVIGEIIEKPGVFIKNLQIA